MTRDKKYLRAHMRLFVGIICLLLVVVGSGSIILAIHNTTSKKGATRGTVVPTRTNHATSTSIPTSVASADPGTEPGITPTPTPFFYDNFLDNTQDWYVGASAGYTRALTSGGLQLTDTRHNPLIESLPTSHKFDDFTLTVTLALQAGDNNDSAGIYLRGDSNLDHDYRLDIFGDSKYAFSEEYLDTSNKPETLCIITPTSTAQLKPMGHANTLTVIMKGSLIVLQVNGKIVDTVVDSSYTKGQIALFVDNGATSQGVIAVFSSIEIAPIPDQGG